MSNNTQDALELQKKMTVSIISIYSFFGFLGNPLLMFIMTRAQFRDKSLFRFLSIASFFNMWQLIMWIMASFSSAIGMNSSPIACKIFYYFGYLPHESSTWIELWSGIDRYISVKFPQNLKFRNTLKYQALIVLIIMVINMLLNIAYPIEVDVVSNVCHVTMFSLALANSIAVTFHSTLIPGVLMVLFTILIYKQLSYQRTKFNQNNKKEISFLKTLISVYLLYLICYVPYGICSIVADFMNIPFVGSILFQVTNYLCSFYSSCYFFIIFFSNKLVRNYFFLIFSKSNRLNNKKTITTGASAIKTAVTSKKI